MAWEVTHILNNFGYAHVEVHGDALGDTLMSRGLPDPMNTVRAQGPPSASKGQQARPAGAGAQGSSQMNHTLSGGTIAYAMQLSAFLFAIPVLAAQGKPSQDDIHVLIEKLRSESVKERERAGMQLKEIGQPALKALRKAGREPDGEVALRCRQIIRAIQIRQQLTPTLRRAMVGLEDRLATGDDTDWTQAFLEAVSWHKSRRRYPELTRRDLIPLALRAARGARTSNEMLEVCTHAATKQLHPVEPELVRYLRDRDGTVRWNAVLALYRLGALEVVPRILPMLDHKDADLRKTALEILGRLGPPEAAGAVVKRLNDPEAYVRFTALQAVRQAGYREAIPGLMKILESDNYVHRRLAIEALGHLGAKSAIPRIRAMLTSDRMVLESAIRALADLGDRESVPHIVAHLHRADWGWRRAAVWALQRISSSDARSAMLRLIRDPEEDVRFHAGDWLCTLGHREGVAALLKSPYCIMSLNGVRRPIEWKRLDEPVGELELAGTRRDILVRLAKRVGLALDAPGEAKRSDHPKLWMYHRVSAPARSFTIREALRECIDAIYEPVLERDRIRILRREDAIKFWRAWWSEEQEKRPKK